MFWRLRVSPPFYNGKHVLRKYINDYAETKMHDYIVFIEIDQLIRALVISEVLSYDLSRIGSLFLN